MRASATLIAYGGAGDPGSGGNILFLTESGGSLARVEVFGNGNIDFSRRAVADNTIGSLEGDGFVYLGDGTLAIGGNNISTTFGGTITEQAESMRAALAQSAKPALAPSRLPARTTTPMVRLLKADCCL